MVQKMIVLDEVSIRVLTMAEMVPLAHGELNMLILKTMDKS